MKKIISLCMLLIVTLSFGQTGTTPQDFKTPVRFKVVSENPTLSKALYIDNNGLVQYKIESGPAIIPHNDLSGLQGGIAGQRYHLSQTQYNRVLNLIYVNNTSTFTLSPIFGERGVSVPVTLNYNIISNDDIFTAASINQSVGSVLSNVNAGLSFVSGGSKTATTTYTLTMNYNRQEVATTETKNVTYNSYIPQWAGCSAVTDFPTSNTYTWIGGETNLQKFIQANSVIQKSMSPLGEYIWFITYNGSATITDGNNFIQTVGTWDDGVSEFYKKSVTLTLADGTTNVTVYYYRSRNTKTLSSFTYKLIN